MGGGGGGGGEVGFTWGRPPRWAVYDKKCEKRGNQCIVHTCSHFLLASPEPARFPSASSLRL